MGRKSRAETAAATREALLSAALRSYQRAGLDGESLDTICASAGFTRGAFYVHFPDKDALLAGVMERVLTSFIAETVRADQNQEDVGPTVLAFTSLLLELAATPPRDDEALAYARFATTHLHLVLSAVSRSDAVRTNFIRHIGAAAAQLSGVAAHGQEAGHVRDDLAATELGTTLLALAIGLLTLHQARVPLDLNETRLSIARLFSP